VLSAKESIIDEFKATSEEGGMFYDLAAFAGGECFSTWLERKQSIYTILI
jgi:hypothetical protein